MKRNLTKRVFAAAALAVIAAAVSACGSSNNNNGAAASSCTPVAGAYGYTSNCVNGAVTAGLGGVSVNTAAGGCTVSFQGNGYIDISNGINGQFQVTGEEPGMAQPSGSYIAGRISQADGTTLEVYYQSSGQGSYVTVYGILSMSQTLASFGYCNSPQAVTLNTIGQAAQTLGQPFPETLFSGQVGINGQVLPYY